jgi:hypothetical protein
MQRVFCRLLRDCILLDQPACKFNGFRRDIKKTTISTSRKRVFGGLYRQICARERKLRKVFVIY